jgi:hypothetical protein
MTPATLLAIIGPLAEIIRAVLLEARLLRDRGEITAEQLAEIRQRAAVSDEQWDRIAAAATGAPPAGQPEAEPSFPGE